MTDTISTTTEDQETIALTFTPAQEDERYDFGNGFSLPVSAHAVNNEHNINIPVF